MVARWGAMISRQIRYCPLCSVDSVVTFAGLPFTDRTTCQLMKSDIITVQDKRTDVLLARGGIPGSRPVSSTLKHSASVGSYRLHVVFMHGTM